MSIIIQDVLNVLTNPSIHIDNTVDGILLGSPVSVVTGVAVTFLASQEVIKKAKELGINLIISHEGIFYSHREKVDSLQYDPVYEQKCKSILENGLTVYRYHDYVHRFSPDIITAGLLQSLGWKDYETENLPAASIVELPSPTLQDVIKHIKNCLGVTYVRYAGELSMPCRRIGVLVGYRGGSELAIPLFHKKNLDMVIYGEGPEWETPEYVKDAAFQGKNKSIIVLGHNESEAPGMKYLSEMLKQKLPTIPVYFIPHKPIFQIC